MAKRSKSTSKTEHRAFRIRPCNGNRSCWLLIRLRADGSESHSYGSYHTSTSLDSLLKYAGHLAPRPGDRVEFIPSQSA